MGFGPAWRNLAERAAWKHHGSARRVPYARPSLPFVRHGSEEAARR